METTHQEIIYQFKEGDIIQIIDFVENNQYPYYTNIEDVPLNEKEILDNFISIAELRNQKIDEILG